MPRTPPPALAAIGPMTWGTTYAVTTELLPADRPLLAGLLRALPAGLLLLSPVVALVIGVAVSGESLTAAQVTGALLVLGAVVAGLTPGVPGAGRAARLGRRAVATRR